MRGKNGGRWKEREGDGRSRKGDPKRCYKKRVATRSGQEMKTESNGKGIERKKEQECKHPSPPPKLLRYAATL